MDDLPRVEEVETLENLNDVACYKRLRKFSEVLECLLQRSVLDELEDDVEVVLAPDESFVLDDARMSERLEQSDFMRKLSHLFFGLAFETDPLDGDDSSRVEVESTVHGAKLSLADALAELLRRG